MSERLNYIRAAAGGLIDGGWTFENMAPELLKLPAFVTEADVIRPELLLAEDGPISIYYCPFDRVNIAARIVFVGITPGRSQMFRSLQEAQSALKDGATREEALLRASKIGGFAGTMRRNLVEMLNGVSVNDFLNIDSCESLFNVDAHLLNGTSMICYPAFKNGENYTGSAPRPDQNDLLKAFTDQVLVAELRMIPDAKIIPLGKAVATVLQREVNRGAIDAERCLLDFPHPSGGNGWRVRLFNEHREKLTAQVAGW